MSGFTQWFNITILILILESQTSSGAQIKSKATCFLAAEMKKDEYTVGKDASCSYIIKDSQLDKIDYNLLPNKQFKISRKKNVAYLENLGVTYINEKKVDQGQKTVLKHNDRIAITKPHLTGRNCCQHDAHKAHSY